MQRTHERKMETFYHLENLDLEKEKFVILLSSIEGQLGQGRKKKRKTFGTRNMFTFKRTIFLPNTS